MYVFPFILAFILGTVVGSFLNVVSLRYDTGKNLGGRSACMSCKKKLTWVELVPLFSFLVQKGKCLKCESKISWQYPLVEFVAGALFVLIFLTYPPVSYTAAILTVIHVLAACLLLVITVYDIRHKIIPDPFVFAFAALALLSLFVGGSTLWHVPGFEALIAGPLLAVPFALLWVISGGRWMGFGDAKLAIGIGWFLGISGGFNAVILAFWIGAICSVLWLWVSHKKFKKGTEVPLGPYLILGMYIVLLFGVKVIDFTILRSILGV